MRIKETIKNHGYTISAVATELGVSQSALSQSMKNPTASTMIKIAAVIGCSPGEFFMDGEQRNGASLLCPHCGKPLHVKLETE